MICQQQLKPLEARCRSACIFHIEIEYHHVRTMNVVHFGYMHIVVIILNVCNVQREKCVNLKKVSLPLSAHRRN